MYILHLLRRNEFLTRSNDLLFPIKNCIFKICTEIYKYVIIKIHYYFKCIDKKIAFYDNMKTTMT